MLIEDLKIIYSLWNKCTAYYSLFIVCIVVIAIGIGIGMLILTITIIISDK